MIPSRPLSFLDTITETFSVYGRSLLRFAILFLILFVPGSALLTAGCVGLAQNSVASAQREIGFDDSALTVLRNDASAWLAVQDPFLALAWPVHDTTGVPHAATRAFVHFLGSHIANDTGPLEALGFGMLLFLIGFFALGAGTIELASQLFEERGAGVWEALRSGIVRNVWNMLFLTILWIVLNSFLEGILTMLPAQAAGALAGFITGAQLYVLIRLAVTFPALVSEELGPFVAVQRSWELTQRTSWKVLGTAAAFGILYFVAILVVSMALSVFSGTALNGLNDFFAFPHLTLAWFHSNVPAFLEAVAVEMGIAALILFSLVPIFLTVLYYDLRTRHDGPLVYLE